MTDLTLLYYTANRIDTGFAQRVREALFESTQGVFPAVVVSHKPMELARYGSSIRGICIGDVPPSIWRVYQNILAGAKAATTPFVACCEDDTVYAPDHFTGYRPQPDVFGYDLSRWVITRQLAADRRRREALFYWRERHQMAMCVAPRALLIETLEERFAKYPVEVPHEVAKRTGWGEPGRYEKNLGLTPRRLEYFRAAQPSVTFNHAASLMGRRKVNPGDQIRTTLPPWGEATALWNQIHG